MAWADWLAVPAVGSIVTANHPVTVTNPTKWFEVTEVRVERGKASARGARTMWFNVDMLYPAPPGTNINE